jgi:hypothetical protein
MIGIEQELGKKMEIYAIDEEEVLKITNKVNQVKKGVEVDIKLNSVFKQIKI